MYHTGQIACKQMIKMYISNKLSYSPARIELFCQRAFILNAHRPCSRIRSFRGSYNYYESSINFLDVIQNCLNNVAHGISHCAKNVHHVPHSDKMLLCLVYCY